MSEQIASPSFSDSAQAESQPVSAVPYAAGSDTQVGARWSRILVVVLVLCVCLGLALVVGAAVLNAQGVSIFSTIAEPLCPPTPCH